MRALFACHDRRTRRRTARALRTDRNSIILELAHDAPDRRLRPDHHANRRGRQGAVYDTMLFSSPLLLGDARMRAPCDALVMGASAPWTRPTEPKAIR